MGDTKGFLKTSRQSCEYRAVEERVADFGQVAKPRPDRASKEQASRCMDCGTPFCHWGCPIGNYIPEWNDAVFSDHWEKAFVLLNASNPLPEITGRVCPALCEYACVLGINDDPVTIRENELAIIEHAFKKGLIKPNPPKTRTGKKIAVIGSGPAGLSAAATLNQMGHTVTVFEKDEKPGGILRFGIPDFKLEKEILDRRISIWKKEGITFKTGINVGKDYPTDKLLKEFDAVCLSGGSRHPRDLKVPGRELKGIYFAMDYLMQSNRRVAGTKIPAKDLIDAKGKNVVVIGGGDTGADCVGTARRQGAKSITQIEVLPKPSACRPENQPWPGYPAIFKTSSSHEEGCNRHWEVVTKEIIGKNGQVQKIVAEACGKELQIEADLVLLAIGFLHPEQNGLLENLKVAFSERGNVKTDENYITSVKGVFSAGDMRRGQSLVVWAIYEGRQAAQAIDKYLL
ncbi:MAG: glutamate synthase subunit beta [Candidatus Saganbacteria bacterium]|nr:glutamate synthase subunit beta [Candidatus Saganbacteria bacterium]